MSVSITNIMLQNCAEALAERINRAWVVSNGHGTQAEFAKSVTSDGNGWYINCLVRIPAQDIDVVVTEISLRHDADFLLFWHETLIVSADSSGAVVNIKVPVKIGEETISNV